MIHINSLQVTRRHSPISLGLDEKSLKGIGIFFTMYSHTTSILYLSWADIGIIGAPSATVPEKQRKVTLAMTLHRTLAYARSNVWTQIQVNERKQIARNSKTWYRNLVAVHHLEQTLIFVVVALWLDSVWRDQSCFARWWCALIS